MAKKTVTSKKRNVRVNAIGQLHVHSSFNNIIVSLANDEGQIISWSSAGKMGFRGSKKNTPYAAQMAAEDCAKVACYPWRRYRGNGDYRCNSTATQRMSSSKASSRIIY